MDANLNYLDVYKYDIELYQFITKKYGESEKAWKLFFASYIDPDGYSGEGIRYVNDVKCTSDALLSIRRIHAKEGFGKEFIEVFSDYRKASIFYFPCEDGGINQSRAKYLEDRIDHTLLDLKNYCAGKKNCFLKEAYRKPKTKAWLDSFKNEFERIADSMNLVGTFVNEKYEVIDIERSDGCTLNNLKETYINPRCKAYLSAWSSDYYKNLKVKIASFKG